MAMVGSSAFGNGGRAVRGGLGGRGAWALAGAAEEVLAASAAASASAPGVGGSICAGIVPAGSDMSMTSA